MKRTALLVLMMLFLATQGAATSGDGGVALDDSDPEMRALVESYYQLVPCGHPPKDPGFVQCPESIALMASGGDRLARYLIRQIEAQSDDGTYLHLLGRTQSEVAIAYLARLVQAQEGLPANDRIAALESYGNTRSIEAAKYGAYLLDSTDDEELLIRAVNMIDRAQAKHGAFPAMQPKLRALAERKRDYVSPDDPDGDTLVRRIHRVLEAPGRTQ